MSNHLIQSNFQMLNMNSNFQNRIFTKEDFEKNYFILNSNENDTQKKILVNAYFEELKKSNQLLNICKEILIENSNKSQDLLLFSSILIRQYLIQNINIIIQNETYFQNTKNLLLKLMILVKEEMFIVVKILMKLIKPLILFFLIQMIL